MTAFSARTAVNPLTDFMVDDVGTTVDRGEFELFASEPFSMLETSPGNFQAGYRVGEGVTVDDLASRGAMSARTLNRRFRSALGIPPGEWLQRERLGLAQRLLEGTDEPIATVARRAGYESPATMRAQFAARLRTSPRAYRDTFRGRPQVAAV